MKNGGQKVIWTAGLILVATATKGIVPDAPGNRYVGIADRNVFRLVAAPTNQPVITQPEAPRAKIIPTGIITGYLGGKRALFKVQFPAKPPEPAKAASRMVVTPLPIVTDSRLKQL